MKKNRLLFLTLSTFHDTGGIQKVCRSMCKALAELDSEQTTLEVLSLCDYISDIDERYLPASKFKGFSYRKPVFILQSFLSGMKNDTLMLSHVNLIPVAMLIKAFRPNMNIILLCHGIEIWRPLSSIKKRFLQKHVSLWPVSNYTAKKIIAQHRVDPNQVHILHNGLDPFFKVPKTLRKPAHLLDKYGLTDDRTVLFCLSRIYAYESDKGYDQLINALPFLLKETPGLCYLLAGKSDATETDRLNRLIQKNGLENHVKLIGYIPDEELVNHYLLADIFIMPSKKEGFGLVLIEAAACGCSVICGQNDGSREAVLNGKLGTLIDPDSKDQLVNAIHSCLRAPKSCIQTKAIQRLCMDHFSYKRYSENVKHLLTSNRYI